MFLTDQSEVQSNSPPRPFHLCEIRSLVTLVRKLTRSLSIGSVGIPRGCWWMETYSCTVPQNSSVTCIRKPSCTLSLAQHSDIQQDTASSTTSEICFLLQQIKCISRFIIMNVTEIYTWLVYF